jgi:hypothetical protein
MPTTKLVFVKLLLELADDTRFTMELNDSQKLDYLLLLLMAGLTHNEIPQDFEWFRSRFHLEKNSLEIQQNIEKIRKVFKKLIVFNGKLKLKNFKELHNYIYKEKENSLGILKEFYKASPNKVNLFLIISSLISFYITKKGFREEDVQMPERNRYGKALKELLINAKGDDNLVKEGIEWLCGDASKNNYSWTLETLLKKWAEFKSVMNTPEILRKFAKKER